jgi:hypothetical protein
MITTLIEDALAKRDAIKERLRLKYLPPGADLDDLSRIEAFLAMSDEEQRHVLDTSFNEEAEFFIGLLTARALYKAPVDRHPGSITEDKVAAYPERYSWKP